MPPPLPVTTRYSKCGKPSTRAMYKPNLPADAAACRIIRFLLAACLAAPLLASCASSLAAADQPAERATPLIIAK